MNWKALGVAPADILLPNEKIDLTAYAVVACDQYTSEPEYWEKAEALAKEKPSTLRMILPEIYLEQAQNRVPEIHKAMADYLDDGILETKVQNGFVLTLRETESGCRAGLVLKLDLEQYSFEKGASSLVRATEGTILSRIPPRMAVRQNAPLEFPHVLVLMDDSERTVIEPLVEIRDSLPLLYDFPLMLSGGHIKGYAITEQTHLKAVHNALTALKEKVAFLFAVGDGNHSLATAKAVWNELKQALSESARQTHPARFALVEIENVHCDALQFEPIHRLVTNADTADLLNHMAAPEAGKHTFTVITEKGEQTLSVPNENAALPVGTLQNFLDSYLKAHEEAEIDYIHGETSLCALAAKKKSVGFLVPTLEKSALFTAVNKDGALPRKTFSMGEAHEKRYYLEGRMIK
jgi:Protein of unknown function (DUF1015).